jgi:sodium transport system ATP-binding protein
MRIISATLRPSAGTVLVGGFDVTRQPDDVRRSLGVMPENWGLYGHLSPRDHLRFFGRLFEMEAARIESRANEIFELLEMQEFADRPCEAFSKGMKQKVSLARALLHQPTHLLLDEPTSGLDVMSARHVRDVIRNLSDTGHCIVLSTHILGEAERLCDRIIIMDRGKKMAEGTVAELCRQAGQDNLEDAFVNLIGREDIEVLR